jgi:RNA polymerase sigma factor (sigma-70 family)
VQPTDRKRYIAALAETYGRRLRRFIFTRSRNASDVADLAQEVFLRLMRIENVDTIRSPEAYLFTVASHVLHQHNLKHAGEPTKVDITEMLGDLQLISGDDPPGQADTQQRLDELERMLAPLPPKIRTTLLLHRFAGYSIEEIARELGVARISAKRYLAAGLAYCRNAAANPE